jgi:hypothetical protein
MCQWASTAQGSCRHCSQSWMDPLLQYLWHSGNTYQQQAAQHCHRLLDQVGWWYRWCCPTSRRQSLANPGWTCLRHDKHWQGVQTHSRIPHHWLGLKKNPRRLFDWQCQPPKMRQWCPRLLWGQEVLRCLCCHHAQEGCNLQSREHVIFTVTELTYSRIKARATIGSSCKIVHTDNQEEYRQK